MFGVCHLFPEPDLPNKCSSWSPQGGQQSHSSFKCWGKLLLLLHKCKDGGSTSLYVSGVKWEYHPRSSGDPDQNTWCAALRTHRRGWWERVTDPPSSKPAHVAASRLLISQWVPLFAGHNHNTQAGLATEHSSVTETSVHTLDSIYCGFAFLFLGCWKPWACQMHIFICKSGGELSDPESPFSSHVCNLFCVTL